MMTLNAYIARSGLCSRRKAVALIEHGLVCVNAVPQKNPAYRVQDTDVVCYKKKVLQKPQTFSYILLNKPSGYVCTASDEKGRKTVLDIVAPHARARVYPVGRLDHDSTGILLLTNDGDLAYSLTHPAYTISKLYQVRLDKPLLAAHAHVLRQGIQLPDGSVRADRVVLKNKRGTVVTVSLHSGKNRIVRRMFGALGYMVLELDRVEFAGLRKGTMAQGGYRRLTAHEVQKLKKLFTATGLESQK